MNRAPLLLLVALLGCQASADGTPREASPPTAASAVALRVEVVTLAPSEALLQLTLPGEVEGSRDARLAAPLGGYVESVLVDDGDVVRKGQALARVDTSVYAARKDQAAAQAKQAAADLVRKQALGDLATPAELEAAETQAAMADANLRLAQINLGRSVVTAPFDGVVSELGIDPGEVASPGAPVARLVTMDPVVVNVAASDRDVVGLRVGMPVLVAADATGTPIAGEIAAISPTALVATRAFRVEVDVANPDQRLRPGMIASVRLAETLASDAVVLPQDWLVTRLDGVGVFVVEEGFARWRPVELGAIVHDQVVIHAGLAVGERVVSTGQRALQDGDPLLIAREGTCCTAGRPQY